MTDRRTYDPTDRVQLSEVLMRSHAAFWSRDGFKPKKDPDHSCAVRVPAKESPIGVNR